MVLLSKYPDLFQPALWPWGPIKAQFETSEAAPPEEQIANVNIAARAVQGWVILQTADGEFEIPGGTKEPGETWLQTARRELLEEAGCVLNSYHVLGGWRCRSLAKHPYRPHLPHPEFYRLVLTGRVTRVTFPTNPNGGEPILAVTILPLDEVARRFQSQKKYYLADLFRLAAAST